MDKPNQLKKVEETDLTTDIVIDPQKVMDNAIKVAKVLDDVVSKSKSKSIIVVNNQKYLMFAAWQTISQFYGFVAQTDLTTRLEDKDGKFLGYSAKALLINLRTGQQYPGAESSCLAVEANWRGKPEFTLKSMAQTRACVKTLANKFRWVATLAGYEGTPGEEIQDAGLSQKPVEGQAVEGQAVESTDERPATPNQLKYIEKNFSWKKIDKVAFEEAYKPIPDLSLEDAKKLLDFLFNKENKNPTLEQVLALFNIKMEGQKITPEETETYRDPEEIET